MPTRFWSFMKNLRKSNITSLLLLFLFVFSAYAEAGDVPIERDFLKLADGRWIWLEKVDWHKTKVMLGKGKKRESNAIWSKTYETDDENRSWEYAYFVHLKPRRLDYDLNGDGLLEVGISTYDMGNNMIRDILIFSVERNQLRFVRNHGPYNIAADESVF